MQRRSMGLRPGATLSVLFLLAVDQSAAFLQARAIGSSARSLSTLLASKKEKEERTEPTLGVKLAWYASEAFGDIVGAFNHRREAEAPVVNRLEALEAADAVDRLRAEYEKLYFVTGNMDVDLYEQDCEFADPFVSFRGTDRFKKNLENLGPFMEDVKLQLTKFEVQQPGEAPDLGDGMVVKTRWRFRCVLGLPWRPSLAAGGGTVHVFSPSSGRIVRHIESWDIDPWDGVKQVFTPGKQRRQDRD